MHTDGGALDLVAEAIEDLFSCSSLNHSANLAGDGTLCTCSAWLGSLLACGSRLLNLLYLLRGSHLGHSSGGLATLSVSSTVVTISTSKAERGLAARGCMHTY